ncbi:site-specific DNA-methyltransferase [Paludisphaera sp.]|uniref:DNA-methyltransferase n=1 Tax=Paludisphaera sp. TaxID=2017432 RepID=UPI00301D2845
MACLPLPPRTAQARRTARNPRKPILQETHCPVRNRIECVDAVDGLRSLPDDCIPLSATSPPFDSIRSYGDHPWDFEKFMLVALELWRVTMPGGIVCWNVQDQIAKGRQTGTSFRQALYFMGLGFRLHNTLIIEKQVTRGINPVRYGVSPEFVFVFSKGRPRSINLIRDKPNKHAGKLLRYSTRDRAGVISTTKKVLTKPFGARPSIWRYTTGGRATATDRYAFEHPALMPEALARDLILSWSRPLDVVLDPLAGAATTCKSALLADRYYLGFEVHEPYHRLAERRLSDAHDAYRRRLLDESGS